jgi:hypothetical protein
VELAAAIAIAANAIAFDIDFPRTPVAIRLKRLLRERPARDVGGQAGRDRRIAVIGNWAYSLFSRSSIKETEPEWTFP